MQSRHRDTTKPRSAFRDDVSSGGRRLVALGMFLLLTCGGCSTRHMYLPPSPMHWFVPAPNTFAASALPPEFAALPMENPKTLDLSRLAGVSAGNERVSEGDLLDLTIAGGLDASAVTRFPVRVEDDGCVYLPQIGRVPIAGLDLGAAEQRIAMDCIHRQLFTEPHVTLTMRKQRANRVTIVGAVQKPGIYEIQRGSSYLLDAFVAAGGLADDAGVNVEIRQPNHPRFVERENEWPGQNAVRPASATMTRLEPLRVNLVTAVAEGQGGIYLDDGAVVMVEKREPPPIHVLGLVRKPGEYKFPPDRDLRVLSAIALAGGESNILADKILVLRYRPDLPDPIAVHISLSRAKRSAAENIRLEPGDVVSIEKTPLTVAMDAVQRVGFGFSMNPLFF